MLRALIAGLAISTATIVSADCTSPGLDEVLAAEEQARIAAEVANHPFSEGLVWHASKDGQSILFAAEPRGVGPENSDYLDMFLDLANLTDHVVLGGLIGSAEDEEQLRRQIVREPDLMFLSDASLIDLLPPRDWAVVQRIVPPPPDAVVFLLAKTRPVFAVSSALDASCIGISAPNAFYRAAEASLRADEMPLPAATDLVTNLRAFDEVPINDRLRWMMVTIQLLDSLDVAIIEIEALGLETGQLALATALIEAAARHYGAMLDPGDMEIWTALEDRDDRRLAASWTAAMDTALIDCTRSIAALASPRALVGRYGLLEQYATRGWTIQRIDTPTLADALPNATIALLAAGAPCTG